MHRREFVKTVSTAAAAVTAEQWLGYPSRAEVAKETGHWGSQSPLFLSN